ncbi:LD-carboxypeptidase [Desulfococcaceae bacterium HSG7]|nr:LD-carboxypeptidase [Desulfococcaceae bacterium HSG7]
MKIRFLFKMGMIKKYKTVQNPVRLSHGDKIGIVAPSSPFDHQAFQNGIAVLEKKGFHVTVPDDLFSKKGYLAGSDKQRALQLNNSFADPEIKAILCARGGFGALRILPFLDYHLISRHPKIFIGFSDITALLAVLYYKCNLVTFHGPVATSLGNAPTETQNAFFNVLMSQNTFQIKSSQPICLNPGIVTAPLTGGNLTTLCHLAGTAFAPDFSDHILLLEDRGEATYRIDRMLSQMKLAGCFDNLTGLVLGSFEECGPVESVYKIVKNIFKSENIPIAAGFEIGHGAQNMTVPLGVRVELDASHGLLTYDHYG